MKGTQDIGEGIEPPGLESGESAISAEDRTAAVRYFFRFAETDVLTLSDEELADWAEWAESKPRHEQFRTAGRVWGRHIKTASKEGGPLPTDSELAADDDDDESVPYSQYLARKAAKRKLWRPGPWTVFLASAACVTAFTIAFVKTGHLRVLEGLPFVQRLLGEQVQSYTTRASERRDFWLSDQSRITLGALTDLTVHYTAHGRLIFLDRGEASFSVAHDARRPFTVFAGGAAITAVGTEFDVRRELDSTQGERVVVTVSSGTVEVGPPLAAIPTDVPDTIVATTPKPGKPTQWTPARLVRGQELTYGTDGPQGTVEHVNLEEAAAWKEGRLEYRHEPFRLVIPRVNRYSQKPIVLADGDVGEMPYSGTVFEGQVADWLRALPKVYPVEVTETPDHFLLRYDREKSGE